MSNPKVVSFSGVTIKNRQKTILENIAFDMGANDFIFLIGKTGSGKSSLIRALYGDLPIAAGQAEIVGFDLKTIKKRHIYKLRRKLGVVFQDFKLLEDRSIYKNLQFVLKATGWRDKNSINKRIDQVIQMVGLDINLACFPLELSGGEQQRVALARALLNQPQLLIADEPTGNLDPETSREIMQLFRKLHNNNISILMATHNYNMIMKFPGKIYQCDEGSFFEVVAKR